MLKKFLHNQKLAPFETMLAFFFIYAGTLGLLYATSGWTPRTANILGFKTTFAFNACYLLAGGGMFFGIGLGKPYIEAFGLIMVATSLITRAIIIGWLAGINFITINSLVLNCMFVLSCIVRLINVIKHHKSKEFAIVIK